MTTGTCSLCSALLNVSTVPLSESFDVCEGEHSGVGLSWQFITWERDMVSVIFFFCFCCVNFVLCSIPQPPCLWLPFLPPFELSGKFWSNSSVTPGTNPGKGLFIVASISDLQANASCGCIVKVSNCLLILRGQGERIRAHAIGKRLMEWYTPGLHFRLHPSSLRVWAYNTNYTWRRQCFVLWCSCVFTACCWCENRAITRQNMFNHSKKIFSFVLFVLLCKVFPISKGCLFVKKKKLATSAKGASTVSR